MRLLKLKDVRQFWPENVHLEEHHMYLELKQYQNDVVIICTRNPASRASKHARLVAMYIAVAIRPRARRGAVNGWILISFCQEMACLAVYSGF